MVSQRRLIGWSLTVALGGFLFGFDTAVISGAEQEIQALWGLSDALHGLAVAIALYGTVIGALLGGIPSDRLGRRATLVGIGCDAAAVEAAYPAADGVQDIPAEADLPDMRASA